MALIGNANGFHPNLLLLLEQRHNDNRDQQKNGDSIVEVLDYYTNMHIYKFECRRLSRSCLPYMQGAIE